MHCYTVLGIEGAFRKTVASASLGHVGVAMPSARHAASGCGSLTELASLPPVAVWTVSRQFCGRPLLGIGRPECREVRAMS